MRRRFPPRFSASKRLGLGGLSLADLLRLQGRGPSAPSRPPNPSSWSTFPADPATSICTIFKPNAPAEYRGEFKPIRTNVPGMEVCELMPRHAEIADKFAVLRGLKTQGNHDPTELLTGIPAAASGHIGPVRRPAFGCVVSKLRGADGPIPPYVSVSDHRLLSAYDDPEEPAYLGAAHRPFGVQGQVMKDMTLTPEVTRERLEDRKSLVHSFDAMRRDLDNARQTLAGMDSYQARAFEMIASTQVRDALDLNREPEAVREKYGAGLDFLRARRLVEAGVSVVSVASRFPVRVPGANDPGGWDTHGSNFKLLRAKLPIYDQAMYALLTDLADRGLDKNVAVVIWGEFRTDAKDRRFDAGRPRPLAAGGLRPIGGRRSADGAGRRRNRRPRKAPRFRPYTTQNVLATLYHVLGIDPGAIALPNFSGRPQYLLDDPEPIAGLI